MFRLKRPTAATINDAVSAARRLPISPPSLLAPTEGLVSPLHPGLAHDRSRSVIGHGPTAFDQAKVAFRRWRQFDLGWVRVANPSASIALGQPVAVEVHSLGLWTLNLSRIVHITDSPDAFGFIYSTTPMHVEHGEERFLLRLDPSTGEVAYELEAVSRPRHMLARLAYPVTRHFQHRFARESHRRMQEEFVAPAPFLS